MDRHYAKEVGLSCCHNVECELANISDYGQSLNKRSLVTDLNKVIMQMLTDKLETGYRHYAE